MKKITTPAGIEIFDLQSARTASAAYDAAQANNTILLGALIDALREHRAKAATKPRDWGFPGDLQEVQGKLQDALEFLGAL